jgi:hypothetical protein
MKFQTWALWAVAVAFLASLLQVGAFVYVHAPFWGPADILAQGAIWLFVGWFALALRPTAFA